jgi:hypothetical protein
MRSVTVSKMALVRPVLTSRFWSAATTTPLAPVIGEPPTSSCQSNVWPAA